MLGVIEGTVEALINPKDFGILGILDFEGIVETLVSRIEIIVETLVNP